MEKLRKPQDEKGLQAAYKGLFRPLYSTEIDVMVNWCNENKISFILHKNARTDMMLLDETFGPFGWQREHIVTPLPNGGVSQICKVSIKDKETGVWVSKADAGSETAMEAEKGQASDSFKRACTNWGIGRELYTCPELICPRFKNGVEVIKAIPVEGEPNRYMTNDTFCVEYIGCDEYKRINFISIKDLTTNRRVLVIDLRDVPDEENSKNDENTVNKAIPSECFEGRMLSDLTPDELVHEYSYAKTQEMKKNCLDYAVNDKNIKRIFNQYGIPVGDIVITA